MKLVFSEATADYDHYIFPYVVWGFPEPGESPSSFFEKGFLPSSRNLDRFYLCRQIRVNLAQFTPSSENRRILRKGANFTGVVVERERYEYSDERRAFFKCYADARFGPDVMSLERLDSLMSSPVVSHLIVFHDTNTGLEVGHVMAYLAEQKLAYYYYAFYDIKYAPQHLGMFMMTWTVAHFAALGFAHIYLGTCYSESALYKFQFAGCEFFTGFNWRMNEKELRYRIGRESKTQHLLEDLALAEFYPPSASLPFPALSHFRVPPAN